MAEYGKQERDRPWIMRTYSGHSTATASNELYRTNLAKGQTGLSVAFDLPTQTGYDADDPLAHGEVGKVGVPVSHIGDMRGLFEGLPLDQMNTSMTINATAVWLLSLYVAVAEDQGVDPSVLRGTTQNDIIKEYLSRGTHIFPPVASMRLITDLITYTVNEAPKWNPINICSYHLQEAGATPTQELAYALVTAIGVLDAVKATGRVPEAEFGKVVGRMSFFVNAGIRFVEELCKMRAFVELWDRITQERYGVTDPKQRRFRYGVQVNSLGLTEQQPENNVIRIVLEMLAVTLSKDARARAIQLPAWNEALGLPRPWDQQWSLRAQQILAYESDLLEYADLFKGSEVVEAQTQRLVDSAWAEVQEVLKRGGAVEAVESAPSPLTENLDEAILTVDPEVDANQRAALGRWKVERDNAAVEQALAELQRVATTDENMMTASIAAAHAGVTTGEWANTLRQVWGEYRAPTGVAGATVKTSGSGASADVVDRLRSRLSDLETRMGRRPKLLVGKPGLDGHSNGAEQIAIKARDVGFDVVYEGIRVSPEQIVASALEEGVHLIGLSILSGSHLALVPEVAERLRAAGLGDVPLVVGGIIPDADAERLRREGIAAVYTPKDFELDNIMSDLIDLVDRQHAAE